MRTLSRRTDAENDELLAGITVYRQEVRAFTDKQIELVKEISHRAGRYRHREYAAAHRIARIAGAANGDSEVLGVISRSKFDLQPILQSVVETAERLCRAEQTVIFRLKNGAYRFAAGHAAPRNTWRSNGKR